MGPAVPRIRDHLMGAHLPRFTVGPLEPICWCQAGSLVLTPQLPVGWCNLRKRLSGVLRLNVLSPYPAPP